MEMLSQHNQKNIIRPFETMANEFTWALQTAQETLVNWEKARSIDASGIKAANNVGLQEKITQLKTGKAELDLFLDQLKSTLQTSDKEIDEIMAALRPTYARFTMMFSDISSLLNFKYTIQQKNQINRRITSVNSSGMLNNTDMEAIQSFWSKVLNMKNDRKLVAAKQIFESRLTEWEDLISRKRTEIT